MFTRWRFLGYLLVLCLLVIVVAWVLVRRHELAWGKYQLIQREMTEEEVEQILGPPSEERYPGEACGSHDCYWEESERTIFVSFLEGRVVEKKILRKSPREQLVGLLRRLGI
jgi:hypothetical protein